MTPAMRVLIAPNAFRGGPSASWVADALAAGVRALGGDDSVTVVPLSDGGDGALDVASALHGGRRVQVQVASPLGCPGTAQYSRMPDGTAFIESAQASGLHRLGDAPLDPLRANTAGTGELISDAVRGGARRLVVTAGGSASVDMGAGALGALGLRFLGADGREIPASPARLVHARRIDRSGLLPGLPRIPTTVLSDVATPLGANIAEFGAQKGIGPSQEAVLNATLDALCTCFGDAERALMRTPLLGAGGGLAAGLHAVLDAEVISGSDYFLAASGLADHIKRADLVVTAEGRFDRTSLDGKLPYAIAELAARLGKPTLIVTGESTVADDSLPGDTRIIELGSPPPPSGQAATPQRARLFARRLAGALRDRKEIHATRS